VSGTPARTRPSWSVAFDSAAGAARASICSGGFGGRSISHNQRGIDLAFASVEEDLGPVAHSLDDGGFSPAPRGQSQLPVFWGTLVTI
jgi:hypothetical protein